MALFADLYLDRIEIRKYLPQALCDRCGNGSCSIWLEKLKAREVSALQCPHLDPGIAYGLDVVLGLEDLLPKLETTQHPVSGIVGWQEINKPGPDAPILVTGNASITQEVLMCVLSTTSASFHVLFVDTGGHTVDMAMVYGTLTATRILQGLKESGLEALVSHREIIIPGLAWRLKGPLETENEWKVRVGPVCAGELPLFMGPYWMRP